MNLILYSPLLYDVVENDLRIQTQLEKNFNFSTNYTNF